jgi:adenylate cyclase
MNEHFLARNFVDGLSTGIAVADPETWAVLYENNRFSEWFPAETDGAKLTDRLPEFNMERARQRIDKGRAYRFEADVGTGAAAASLGIELKADDSGGGKVILVECQNVSKQKEAEYMLDSYARMSERHARELHKEKERVEKLLLNLMPRSVYEEMKEFGTATPQRFDQASVLMLDFVGFTDMSISHDPSALVAELNDIFSSFDRIVELFNCERIKTIGDAYMAVSGLPEGNAEHASSIAKVALRMRRYIERRNHTHHTQWRCRIGISTGPVIGSLIGVQKYVYDILGPAVNMAARMEAFSEPMQITLSQNTYDQIRNDFEIEELGEFEIRGFGQQALYALTGESKRSRQAPKHPR